MIVVIDTNVLVSYLIGSGVCEELVDALIAKKQAVVSKYILNELETTLKNAPKFKLPRSYVEKSLSYLNRYLIILEEDRSIPVVFDPDTKDIPILRLCLSCSADHLITGDKQLLELFKIGGTSICSPADFIRRHLAD